VLTPTKLHTFRLTQFKKVIYLDADTLVIRPLSHLFDLAAPFAAAPDIGWPDCFNSGPSLFAQSSSVLST
jgi:glycogenin glucosyltransferase